MWTVTRSDIRGLKTAEIKSVRHNSGSQFVRP